MLNILLCTNYWHMFKQSFSCLMILKTEKVFTHIAREIRESPWVSTFSQQIVPNHNDCYLFNIKLKILTILILNYKVQLITDKQGKLTCSNKLFWKRLKSIKKGTLQNVKIYVEILNAVRFKSLKMCETIQK